MYTFRKELVSRINQVYVIEVYEETEEEIIYIAGYSHSLKNGKIKELSNDKNIDFTEYEDFKNLTK